MKLIDKLISAENKPLFTFEILPPLKGYSIKEIFDTIDRLKEFNPAVIDVTYHRKDYVNIKKKDGTIEKRCYRKRPGTIGICSAILHRYNIDPAPHLICGGFTKDDIEDMLIELNFLGIDNILVLQGDKLANEDKFYPTPEGHKYASELVEQVVNMKKGKYLDPNIIVEEPIDFCIGVAGYPEKHYEAPDLDTDIKYLKLKVDKGADYIVTQMFFDNKKFFEFVKKCREIGIDKPIIPGIKPLTNKKQVNILPKTFFIDIPEELSSEIKKADTKEKVKEIGIEWCINQCKELIKFGVPALHFYTMGKANPTLKILKEIF